MKVSLNVSHYTPVRGDQWDILRCLKAGDCLKPTIPAKYLPSWRLEYSGNGLLTLRYLYHLVVNHTDRDHAMMLTRQTLAPPPCCGNNNKLLHQITDCSYDCLD